MTLLEFYEELVTLNWFYDYEDDHNRYAVGRREYDRVWNIAQQQGKRYVTLFNAFKRYRKSGNKGSLPRMPRKDKDS